MAILAADASMQLPSLPDIKFDSQFIVSQATENKTTVLSSQALFGNSLLHYLQILINRINLEAP